MFGEREKGRMEWKGLLRGFIPIILHLLASLMHYLFIYLNRSENPLNYFGSLNDSIDWAMEITISSSPYCPIT